MPSSLCICTNHSLKSNAKWFCVTSLQSTFLIPHAISPNAWRYPTFDCNCSSMLYVTKKDSRFESHTGITQLCNTDVRQLKPWESRDCLHSIKTNVCLIRAYFSVPPGDCCVIVLTWLSVIDNNNAIGLAWVALFGLSAGVTQCRFSCV